MTCILTDRIKVIPVHMNSVFTSKFFSFDSNLDVKKFESLINNLNDNDVYILDFENIKNTIVSDSVATVATGLLRKQVMMINLKTSTYNTFQKYFEKDLIDYENCELNKSLMTKQFPYDSIRLPELKNFKYLNKYLKEKCKINVQETNEPRLISSNVYVNKHFDLRRLFGNMDTVKIAVYLMAIKLNELEEKEKNLSGGYKLISSSFNGCILANLIALIKMRKHISIPHLGPEIAVEDNRHMKYIKKGDKLVYIYDFIALGNEQNAVSVIAKLYNAEIVCSLGLTYYRHHEKYKTHSLIDFSEIAENVYFAAEKNDVIKLMRMNKNEKI